QGALQTEDIVNAHDIDGRPFLTIVKRTAGHRIRAHGYADFDVDEDRRHILCRPVPGCPEAIMAQLFIDRVLPNTVSRPDTPAFHSSVIAHQGKAAMFMGDPGLGKSTLASALCPPAEWVCDDSAILRVKNNRIEVHASYSFARLFDDSLGAVGGEQNDRASARNHKWRLPRRTASGPQAVALIFSLASDGPLRLERKTRRDGVTELARHLYRLDPSDRGALLEELGSLDRIARAVPIHELHFPRDYDTLPDVQARILAELARA
ncbi:MAG: hypothetical protein VB934_02170, partial [Polyangiaceae bacterium]